MLPFKFTPALNWQSRCIAANVSQQDGLHIRSSGSRWWRASASRVQTNMIIPGSAVLRIIGYARLDVKRTIEDMHRMSVRATVSKSRPYSWLSCRFWQVDGALKWRSRTWPSCYGKTYVASQQEHEQPFIVIFNGEFSNKRTMRMCFAFETKRCCNAAAVHMHNAFERKHWNIYS